MLTRNLCCCMDISFDVIDRIVILETNYEHEFSRQCLESRSDDMAAPILFSMWLPHLVFHIPYIVFQFN